MNKISKITILVLTILSVSFSGLFYFDLWPFAKKKIESEKTATGFIKEFGQKTSIS